MSKPDFYTQKRFVGGIADYIKENANGSIPDSFYFGRAINYRDDPQALTLLPRAVKESGSVVTDLLKWGDITPQSLTSYFYGNSGNIYSRTSAGSWSNLHMVPNSHGNGLSYFSGDDYVYYTGDTVIGRYGPISGTPQFSDNFLGAEGGVPQNTASFSFVAASSQYLTAADSPSLSQTGDITLETYFKATTLPTVGNSMTLIGKWNETGNIRSYLLDLYGVSGYFGDGSDGPLTISSNTTEAPIDSACTGTSGTQSLSATNASFAAGQVILIHQSQGTNAGQWERNTIQGYTAGTITTGTPLLGTYTTGAQVRVLKQHTNVTVNAGFTYTAKAWNASTKVGGILSFLYNGTLTRDGNISANACGFTGGRPGNVFGNNATGEQGENAQGGTQGQSNSAISNGGGGGAVRATNEQGNGGGGGANGFVGEDGIFANYPSSQTGGRGFGGGVVGSADLTTMLFGGGGGGGGYGDSGSVSSSDGVGGRGGGIIFITGVSLPAGTGTITANGQNGASSLLDQGPGGGGGGGSILLKIQTADLGTSLVTANAGVGGNANEGGQPYTGNGGAGRIHADYLTSIAGTTSPTLNSTQDNTLVTTTTIQARLGISDNGTNFEYLTKNLSSLTTGAWNRLSVSWDASASLATFYLNAVPIGTSTGTKTAISNNTSLLYLGANSTTVVANFFNGLQDDIRIWGNVQTDGQIFANNQVQLTGTEGGLQAYWKGNSSLADSGPNTNTLTNHNTTYSTDVPFPSPTTRLDIDQQQVETGDTYALLTAVSEASTDILNFTPALDPQASVAFNVSAKGTGNWTVIVHDQQNNVIATQTIINANLPSSGAVEFIYTTPWNLVNGKQYHMHLISTVADGTVVSDVNNDFQTADYTTYYSFLVPDSLYHPIVQFQYQPLGGVLTGAIIIGNGRYLATWDGGTYNPNFIVFPPQWKVRCFGFWREFLAVGVWRGGNIYDFDQGRIYFWDGTAPTFNFFINVPEGQVNALYGVDSDLYVYAGYRGQLLDYQVASSYTNGNSRSTKIKRMPLVSATDTTEVFPGALNFWRGLLHAGLYGNSSSSTIQRGVYSFGTLNQAYPETLGFDYALSTTNVGSTVSIGMVFPVGQSLIVGWQDGLAYGADMINPNNAPAPYGQIQMLLQDDGNIWKDSINFAVRTDYLELQGDEYVQSKFSLNRETFVTTPQTPTDTFSKLAISTGRGREYMIGADIYSDGVNSPTIIGVSLQKNPTTSEGIF